MRWDGFRFALTVLIGVTLPNSGIASILTGVGGGAVGGKEVCAHAGFLGGDLNPCGDEGNLGLAGADFGVINVSQIESSDLVRTPPIVNSVVITLEPTRSFTLGDIVDATFNDGYYSETNGVVSHLVVGGADNFVPEPASLAIWLLLGLCWFGVHSWRRRNIAPSWPTSMRQQVNRQTSRPPWPEHVRAAIREIIERGCPR